LQEKIKKLSMLSDTFGRRLRKLRIAKGLSQAKFATLIGYKRSGSISNIENDKTPPDIATLVKIAKCLNIDLHWLITGKASLAVERLRIYTSAYIANTYGKVDDLKMQLAALEVRQSLGQDCSKDIKKISDDIETSWQFAEGLRGHINEVLEPIGRAFK
jgi:transcriptional regulator with XRE-family HTH domain